MNTFAEAEARLVETLPGYESRPQQQALAQRVEEFFSQSPGDDPVHLCGQAGCGCGKSLAYLIPAILNGHATGARTVVSVTTKALQDQLSEKDVPFLEANLGVPFSWAVLKGRANYLCLNRAATYEDGELAPGLLDRLREATQAEGFTGEHGEIPFEVSNTDWSKVCSETEDCGGLDCKDTTTCFAAVARAKAKDSSLVIVNHSLFFTDLLVREMTGGNFSMLDEYDFVVFDEAHEAPDVAADKLGSSFTEQSFTSWVTEVRNWAERYADDADSVKDPHASLLAAVGELWEKLPTPSPTQNGRLRAATILELEDEFVALLSSIKEARTALAHAKLENVAGDLYTKAKKRKDKLLARGASLVRRFEETIIADFDDVVRYVETERRQYRGQWVTRKVLNAKPIDVGPYLYEHLFSKTPALLVSATLVASGGFEFVAKRMGLGENYTGIDVGTPFDFGKQAITYIPTHLPEPRGANLRNWETQVGEEIIDLVKASNGRALVLFTSTKHLNETFDAVAHRIPFTTLKQGQMSQKELVNRFKSDHHSVLFATRSYFTGVDVQGDALSMVIIAKMPFPVPSEPMTEARCDLIKKNGGNDFSEYTIPVMSLTLQQGYGRLIRHREDRGVVAILDPRLVTKGYGQKILRDLPPAPVVKGMSGVEEFFSVVAS